MRPIHVLLLCLCIVTSGFAVDGPCVVPDRSRFQIGTDTSGLFGAFAHEHQIEAQQFEGCASIDTANLMRSSIKLTFMTANIRVMDPKEAKDRPKVQETMRKEVLRVSEYPQIVFESTSIERGAGHDSFSVHGNLTIRGKTQPVIVPVTLTRVEGGAYRAKGSYKFKQSTFGITPIKLAGGTVTVEDEVSTECDILLK